MVHWPDLLPAPTPAPIASAHGDPHVPVAVFVPISLRIHWWHWRSHQNVHPTGLVKPGDLDAKIKFLAPDMVVPVSKMEDSFQGHYQASLETAKDPDGGPFPAYPSGKSWDEASGKTDSGKKF